MSTLSSQYLHIWWMLGIIIIENGIISNDMPAI